MDSQYFDGRGGEEAEKADTTVIVPPNTDAQKASKSQCQKSDLYIQDNHASPCGGHPNGNQKSTAESRFDALSDAAKAVLPPPQPLRWTPRQKRAVVNAVECGEISMEDACSLYALSLDEFKGWRSDLQTFGARGLHVTRLTARRSGRLH